MGYLRLTLMLALLSGLPAFGHEFWIEPEQYQVETDAPLVASLRNGENFKGTSLGWFENRFTRFEMVLEDQIFPIEGRMGDTPALQSVAPSDEGLLVVLHETSTSTLTYRAWEKFLKFLEHKDFRTAVAFHEEMGWAKEGFREGYTRHAKSLVAVGDGSGSDRAFGLKTEFVALTNPYASDFEGTMRVLVNENNAPRVDAQVETFDRSPDGQVTVSLHRTDANGIAEIPVLSGHTYLLDAVVMRPNPEAASAENAPLWLTYWAALTFQVPAN